MSNQPRALWAPPWGWVLLAAVFHQILRKDPGEEATSPPSGLTQPVLPKARPGVGGARVRGAREALGFSESGGDTVGLPGPGRDRALSPP